MAGLPGRTWMAVIHLSMGNGTLTKYLRYGCSPGARTSKSGNVMTASGASPPGCNQPSEKVGAGGGSALFPLGAPALTQFARVAISLSLSRGSLLNFTLPLG